MTNIEILNTLIDEYRRITGEHSKADAAIASLTEITCLLDNHTGHTIKSEETP